MLHDVNYNLSRSSGNHRFESLAEICFHAPLAKPSLSEIGLGKECFVINVHDISDVRKKDRKRVNKIKIP